ncbi:hypothetical protein [Kingella potus]|uniref:hypothetical protein n=1 Tax=Kingella potus TaxID=265175 RepID=UPI001FD1DFE7|nr:hypothetical protein [Kingella potus]UOP00793.1 hypothetical protein LVJ84_13745 [Kingella potus]
MSHSDARVPHRSTTGRLKTANSISDTRNPCFRRPFHIFRIPLIAQIQRPIKKFDK